MIYLNDNFKLPLELITESVGILAVKRAGKSHTAKRIVEQLHYAKQQVVVVDPKGDWWGLRSSRNGKHAGLPMVILGGEHGDIPLEPTSGELVAKLVVEQRVSALLDLSAMRKYQVATFMAAFLETLYRLKAQDKYRTAMMLVIDEADAIAPQRPQKGEERMLGAAEDIVRRGGQRGIGIVMVSQRAAVLNKNVLTQVGVLILLKTTGSQDIDAVDEWIKKHAQEAQREKVMASIAALPRGRAWVWAPGWPTDAGIFKQVDIGQCDTFDSGATPKPGEARATPKTLADVDLDAFRQDMAATIEKVKLDDPRELRKKIAELEQALRKRQQPVAQIAKEKRVEVPILKDSQIKRSEKWLTKLTAEAERHGKAMGMFWKEMEGHGSALLNALRAVANINQAPVRESPRQAATVTPIRTQRDVAVHIMGGGGGGGAGDLAKGEGVVLTAIAQLGEATREQVTLMTGYKKSTRDLYIQRLRAAGMVEETSRGELGATLAGAESCPSFERLPTGHALQNYWLVRLPEGERRVLATVLSVYPKLMDRETISETTGYKKSTRDLYLQRLSVRKLVITSHRGGAGASSMLFD